MNDLNSVLLEGRGRTIDRGLTIGVTTRHFERSDEGVTVTEIEVPVLALGQRAMEQVLQMRDGQGVRLSGRMVLANGQIMVAAENIELRRIPEPEQPELAEREEEAT